MSLAQPLTIAAPKNQKQPKRTPRQHLNKCFTNLSRIFFRLIAGMQLKMYTKDHIQPAIVSIATFVACSFCNGRTEGSDLHTIGSALTGSMLPSHQAPSSYRYWNRICLSPTQVAEASKRTNSRAGSFFSGQKQDIVRAGSHPPPE